MTKMFEVYKCEVCGNITKVVHASGGLLVCCGKPMILQQEKKQGVFECRSMILNVVSAAMVMKAS